MASVSSGSTSSAASPATSGSAERFDVTTGTPAAIASSTGMPKPSSSDGKAKIAARAYHAASSAGGDVARHGMRSRAGLLLDARQDLLGAVAVRSGQHQSPRRGDRLERLHQARDVLALLDRADVQNHLLARRGRRGRGELASPVVHHVDLARGSTPSSDTTWPPRELARPR